MTYDETCAKRYLFLRDKCVRYIPPRGGIGDDGPGYWELRFYIGDDPRTGVFDWNSRMPCLIDIDAAIDSEITRTTGART